MTRAVDWESVEKDYRAGVLTIREIAAQHGVSHVAVLKRAKKSGWERDLTARVREAVTAGLVTDEVTAEEKAATEREIVKQAAATVIQLVREHRRDIRGARAVAETLLAQLAQATGEREEIEAAIVAETPGADGEPGPAQRAEASRRTTMLKAVSLPMHAVVLKDLSVTLKSLIPLEREAFNLESADGDKASVTVDLSDIDRLRARLAERQQKS